LRPSTIRRGDDLFRDTQEVRPQAGEASGETLSQEVPPASIMLGNTAAITHDFEVTED
jgi:hypothetical protein